jgi:hypothetical protein
MMPQANRGNMKKTDSFIIKNNVAIQIKQNLPSSSLLDKNYQKARDVLNRNLSHKKNKL